MHSLWNKQIQFTLFLLDFLHTSVWTFFKCLTALKMVVSLFRFSKIEMQANFFSYNCWLLYYSYEGQQSCENSSKKQATKIWTYTSDICGSNLHKGVANCVYWLTYWDRRKLENIYFTPIFAWLIQRKNNMKTKRRCQTRMLL